MACAGTALFAIDRILPGGLFGAPALQETFSLHGCIAFLAGHPVTILGTLLAGALMFTGYGIHGRRLGVFPGARS
jgi:hypothetical protein